MNKTGFMKGIVLCALLVFLFAGDRSAAQDRVPFPQKWEYKAVPFSSDAAEATKLLNELNDAGWEYVGPLANNLVAFKRVVPTAAEAAARKEGERLQGSWTTTAIEYNGDKTKEEKKTEKITFAGHKCTLKMDGEVTQEGVFKLVEITDKLVKIDFIVTDGLRVGETFIGIYQIDGDRMKWCGCYASDNKVRPKTFSTREGDSYFLRSLSRDK